MPNRILWEKICASETIAELSADEERFFYRLLVQCDDFGRFDARPTVLRTRCFSLQADQFTDGEVKAWLTRLIEVGLVATYTVARRPYLVVTTWRSHQRRRAAVSKWPDPPAAFVQKMSDDVMCRQMSSLNEESLNEESLNEESLNEESRNRSSVFGPEGGTGAPNDADASRPTASGSGRGRKPRTDPPEVLDPTAADYAVGAEVGLSHRQVNAKSSAMLDHFRSKGEQRSDWHATLRTWLRRSMVYDREAPEHGRLSDEELVGEMETVVAHAEPG